jgi:hypothetical protein
VIRLCYARCPADAGYGRRLLLSPLSRGFAILRPPSFSALTYSPSTCSCRDVALSVQPTHCLSSPRCVFTKGATVSGIPDPAYPQVHMAGVSRLTRSTLRDPLRPGTPTRAHRTAPIAPRRIFELEVRRPRLNSAIKKPGPCLMKISTLFLAKITLSKPLPRLEIPGFWECPPQPAGTYFHRQNTNDPSAAVLHSLEACISSADMHAMSCIQRPPCSLVGNGFTSSAAQVLATKNHSHNTGSAPVPISAPAWVQCCGVRPGIRDPLTSAAK